MGSNDFNQLLKQLRDALVRAQLASTPEDRNAIAHPFTEVVAAVAEETDYSRSRHLRADVEDLIGKFQDLTLPAGLLFIMNELPNYLALDVDGGEYVDQKSGASSKENADLVLNLVKTDLRANREVDLLSDVTGFSEVDPKRYGDLFSFAINSTQSALAVNPLAPSDLLPIMAFLKVARASARNLNQLDSFYILSGIGLDAVNHNRLFQIGRDLTEGFVRCAFADQRPDIASYHLFRTYTFQFNQPRAAFYASLFIEVSKRRGRAVYLFRRGFLLTLHIFFRNSRFIQPAKDVFDLVLTLIPLRDFDRNSIHNSHYALLVQEGDNTVVPKIAEYLNGQLEKILRSGPRECRPWLNTMYVAQVRFKGNADLEGGNAIPS